MGTWRKIEKKVTRLGADCRGLREKTNRKVGKVSMRTALDLEKKLREKSKKQVYGPIQKSSMRTMHRQGI
jgi:hypothetical protein